MPMWSSAMVDSVEEFLDDYAPEVRALALGLRALVRKVVPDAAEKLHRPWRTIAYGRTRKFCAIAPHQAWVNLQFHNGATLEDPTGLLEGTGKSMRHVKVTTLADLEDERVATLLRQAAEGAA
ncbi:MAG: DUF1801 domain-containing protein [Chloroflexi bacterium]|nr:MAG: DUF1801 domain-containing protein [Chloroflexota bacterium]